MSPDQQSSLISQMFSWTHVIEIEHGLVTVSLRSRYGIFDKFDKQSLTFCIHSSCGKRSRYGLVTVSQPVSVSIFQMLGSWCAHPMDFSGVLMVCKKDDIPCTKRHETHKYQIIWQSLADRVIKGTRYFCTPHSWYVYFLHGSCLIGSKIRKK